MDILNRDSQREQRDAEQVQEFSINQLVKAGMKDYTRALTDYMQSDSRQKSKNVLQGMFEGDEPTLALIVLRTVLSVLISSDKSSAIMLSSLSSIVAKSVLNAKTISQLENEHQALSNYIDQVYKRGSDSKRLKAKMRSSLNLVGVMKEDEFLNKGNSAISLGSVLISILCESIDIIEIIKLDSRGYYDGRHYPQFKAKSYLAHFSMETKYSLLDLDETARLFLRPVLTPLLVPPKPIHTWDIKDADVTKDGRTRSIIKMPRKRQNLKEFKHVMDKKSTKGYQDIHAHIEATEWTVNEDVLDVITKIFEGNMLDKNITMYQGEHYEFNPSLLGGLPRRYSLEVDSIIDKTKLGRTTVTNKGFTMFHNDKEGLNRYNTIKNDLLAFNEANLNKALSLQSLLTTAREYIGKSMWFTYQYDNRSRIYPVQTGLNPQADSKGKALLKFSGEHGARPLNEIGKYWAKIHGANCYGYDKEDLPKRVALIDGFIADGTLERIAKMPIAFHSLWANVDDPYGFLAFCIEYYKTLKDSDHRYALPCALDATCSGIQIYSGLLKDKEGALAVNVIGQKRNDIYGTVAKVTNRRLSEGKYERYNTFTNANGEETQIDYKPLANSMAGRINRSITKRNTMTQPYSVTLKGMQEQLKETFKEMEDRGDKFWKGEVWQCSKLLASVNQNSIDEVVQGAKRGKEFIKSITRECSKRNKGLLWTTHIGFPVYQKNVKTKYLQLETHIWTPDKGMQRVQFRVNKKVGKVDGNAQGNSCAPNLIHSLDSSLLHLTVDKCVKRNVRSFALIHDSYGVHPNDVPILNEEVRESFIEIFSEDVLYNWAIEVLTNAGFTPEEMMKIFENIDDPMIDTLDLNEVREATFMFS